MITTGLILAIVIILMGGGIVISKKVVNEEDKDKRFILALVTCGFFIGAIIFSTVYGAATERQAQKSKLQNAETEIATEKNLAKDNPYGAR